MTGARLSSVLFKAARTSCSQQVSNNNFYVLDYLKKQKKQTKEIKANEPMKHITSSTAIRQHDKLFTPLLCRT